MPVSLLLCFAWEFVAVRQAVSGREGQRREFRSPNVR